MNESEKQLIMTVHNRNCFKLLCLPRTRHRIFITVLIVLLTFIASLLAVFSVYTFYSVYASNQLPQVTVESYSNSNDVKLSCRSKRSSVSNAIHRYPSSDNDIIENDEGEEDDSKFRNRDDKKFVVSSNLFKRQAEDENFDISELLHEKFNEINQNRIRRRDLQDSLETFEEKLEKTENFLRDIKTDSVDDENAILISKNLHDLSEELNTIDDDIVSLLESSNLLDNTVRKRIRHRRDLSESKKREKRLIQQRLEEVRDEFVRCKKSADGSAKSDDCDRVYHRVMDRFREITKKFQEIEKIVNEMEVVEINDKKSEKKKKKKKSSEEKEKNSSEEDEKITTESGEAETETTQSVTTEETTTTTAAETSTTGTTRTFETTKMKSENVTTSTDAAKVDSDSKDEKKNEDNHHPIVQPDHLTEEPKVGDALPGERFSEKYLGDKHKSYSKTKDHHHHHHHYTKTKVKGDTVIRKDVHVHKDQHGKTIQKTKTKTKFRSDDENYDEEIPVKLQSSLVPPPEESTACPAITLSPPTLTDEVRKHPKFIEDLHDSYHVSSKLHQHHPSLNRMIDRKIHQTPTDAEGKDKVLSHQQSNPIADVLDKVKEIIEEGVAYFAINSDKHESDEKKAKFDSEHLGATRESSFTSLCQNLNVKNSDHQQPPNQHQPQPFAPFSGHYPMTGETSKATSKVVMNPGYNIMPYPVCFMQYPQYRAPQYLYPNVMPMPVINAPTGGNKPTTGGASQIPSEFVRHQAFFMPSGRPVQYPPLANYHGIREADVGENREQKTYCAFMPSENANFPAYYEKTTSTTEAPMNARDEEDRDTQFNIPTQFDIIYATYPNQMFAFNETSNAHHCDDGKLSCFGTNQCIPKTKWCDSIVDCLDASDETACSCKARLEPSRICDGFVDCPMGSDELGCFGCDKFQFSCFANRDEFEQSSRSSLTCYSSLERCDGFNNCQNGRDESECSILVRQLGTVTSFTTASSEGVLHRNFRGRWYPVCKSPMRWAYEACENEVGVSETPKVETKIAQVSGPFIQPGERSELDEPVLSDFCRLSEKSEDNEVQNDVIYVKCGEPKCGVSKLEETTKERVRRNSDAKSDGKKEDDKELVKEARIVGGVTAKPLEFPFIVAIYKDGRFHCGGSIYNEHFIITAAHCCRLFESHHYEVRAGFLRRSSFSPTTQITRVTHVIPHEEFDRSTMRHDIALMRVEHPFSFNKWVRPVCMPSGARTGVEEWSFGPRAGTSCSTLGWGSIREKGPEPDELQVVEISIMSRCKHLSDIESESICAGEIGGQRDACQGDSGGPLACRSASNPNEWYLAGIVSHGEGCARANEPGVYTRLALYIDWLEEKTNPENSLPIRQPRAECPGMNCVWGGSKCIQASAKCDERVDCLGGEDEVNCPLNILDHLFRLGSVKNEKDDEIDPNKTGDGNKDVKNVTKKALAGSVFRCEKISQLINIEQRCDKAFDCEDGTDEVNCTCREHLRGPFTKLICDGHVDCADSSDEEGCHSCNTTDFSCPRSEQCVKKSQHCDGKVDCKRGEDELYCLALTDGHSLTHDINGRPHLHSKGIVARNINGKWSVFCDDNGDFLTNATSMADDICHALGFRSQRSVRIVSMSSDEIKARASHRPGERIECNFVESCLAMEVECSPHAKNPHPMRVNNDALTFKQVNRNSSLLQPKLNHLRDFEPPWSVEIYSNGELAGIGLLLDRSWILAEQTILGNGGENPLERAHVVALVGNTRSEINIQTPYEQIARIDCLKTINESTAMLLHLAQPLKLNRHVMPTFVPKLKGEELEEDEACMAIAVSGMSVRSLKSLAVESCGGNCFTAKVREWNCSESHTSHRVATILCRTMTSAWYPKGFYQMKQGFCDFTMNVTIDGLGSGHVYEDISSVIDNPTCDACIKHTIEIPCDTHRCPLGKCLSPPQLCNQIADCHDASDETSSICEKANHTDTCHPHEFQCRNKRCIAKQMFCNHIDECGDKSDEPSECTCFSYLRATNPSKICDGVVHCWDRTDESAEFCVGKCDETKFVCDGSSHCVPNELVCDGLRDCPGGEDEAKCQGAYEILGSDGFFGVLQRTNGLWHTKCYPRSSPPEQDEIEELCGQLGLKTEENSIPQARLKISMNGTDTGTAIPIAFHDSQNATKVVMYSRFSPTKISDDFTIHIKTDKPLAKIVKWDKGDEEKCFQLDIKC